MLNNIKKFIGYNENKIKRNNRKIKDLRVQISDYETVIEIIEKTDISESILSNYKNKIEDCLLKIDSYMEENLHTHNMIIALKRARKIASDCNLKKKIS